MDHLAQFGLGAGGDPKLEGFADHNPSVETILGGIVSFQKQPVGEPAKLSFRIVR